MRSVLLYSSKHGRTRRVVTEALKQFAFSPGVYNVADSLPAAELGACELLIIFTPTYGDEELEEKMEDFLVSFNLDLAGKRFLICELGNYYGYDDFTFGAMSIVRRKLLELNGLEFCEPLSLDSFPRLNWQHLSNWVTHVNNLMRAHAR